MSLLAPKVNLTNFFLKAAFDAPIADVAAGTTVVIHFPSQFSGIAKAVLLDNQDAANAATYRINSRAIALKSVRTNSSRVIDDQPIELIEITAGAAGAVQVSAQVVPLSVLPEVLE